MNFNPKDINYKKKVKDSFNRQNFMSFIDTEHIEVKNHSNGN